MKRVIEVDLNNAAFEDATGLDLVQLQRELSRMFSAVLQKLPRLEAGEAVGLSDSNGNTVGKAAMSTTDDHAASGNLRHPDRLLADIADQLAKLDTPRHHASEP